ncbi:MAG: pre-peptidase C-terminal domain-containing protein [Gammaproteobacteria bacterium]|nr:pre-peptidase C-terminal domain-containing protein [Gammaproteobacteria bacterium]
MEKVNKQAVRVSVGGFLPHVFLMLLAVGVADAQAQISNGSRVQVNTLPAFQTANVRSTPSIPSVGTNVLGSQSHSALGIVTNESQTASSNTWWKIDFDSGVDGWVAQAALLPAYADLMPQNLSLTPTSGKAGSTVLISFNVRNSGPDTSTATTANIRLSASSSDPSRTDPPLGSVSIGALSSGGQQSFSSTYTIPADTSSAQRYVWVIVDPNDNSNQGTSTANDLVYATFTVSQPSTTPPTETVPQTTTPSATPAWPAGWTNPTAGQLGGTVTLNTMFGAFSTGCSNAKTAYHAHYLEPSDEDYAKLKYAAHLGLDIDLDAGSDVYPVASGTVLQSDRTTWGSKWAGVVRVEHVAADGSLFVVTYGHLDNEVLAGHVEPTVRLGTVADLGRNSHLHIGLREVSYVHSTEYKASTDGYIENAKNDVGSECSLVQNQAKLNMLDPLLWLPAHQAPTQGGSSQDTTAPGISAFSVSPGVLAVGQSATISFTVSDTGGSSLNRIVLRRTAGDGSDTDPGWQDVDSKTISGSGPLSGSFTSELSSSGDYWYGLAVFDNAGNSKDEQQAGFGPSKVTSTVPLGKPTAATYAAANISETSVTLNSSINPGGSNTSVYFQYGTTTSYGSTTASTVLGSGSSNVSPESSITGLQCGTTYNYQAVATNASGTTYGNNQTFTTAACPVQTNTPTLSITSPAATTGTVSNNQSSYSVSGIAAATGSSLSAVEWRLNGGSWNVAIGSPTTWYFTIADLPVGINLIEVRACNSQVVCSSVESRTITRSPPAEELTIPVLQSPGYASSPGELISTLTPTFKWSAAGGAITYELNVWDVTDSGSTYENQSTGNATSLSLPSAFKLKPGHLYYWTMRAVSSLGFASARTTPMYFQTAAASSPAEPNSTVLQNSQTISGTTNSTNSGADFREYTLTVPAGTSHLLVTTSDPGGDVDLYVKFGSMPTLTSYDCRPYQSGSNEICSFTNPQTGIWYIRVYGYNTGAQNFSIKTSWTAGSSGSQGPSADQIADTIITKTMAANPNGMPSIATDQSSSTAHFYIAVSSDQGSTLQTNFLAGDNVMMAGSVIPQPADLGMPADVFIVVKTLKATGESWWYLSSDASAIPWDGWLASLEPAYQVDRLETRNVVQIHNGELQGNRTHWLYIGYRLAGKNGPLYYSLMPLQVIVF